MVEHAEQTEWLNKKLGALSKELRKTNTQLAEFLSIKNGLETVLNQLSEIREKIGNDSAFSDVFEKELQTQQILQLFNQLKTQVELLKKNVAGIDEKMLAQSVFLENYRTYRQYNFSQTSQTIRFLTEAAELYGFDRFVFKPAFVGLVSFEPVKKELEMEKKDESTFLVPVSKLEGLFSFLVSKKFANNFRLDNEKIRVLCKNIRELKVEAQNPLLKRLDRTVISLEGKVLED